MKAYTGLESLTDSELIDRIEWSDDPLPHELLRRATDAARDIEDYKATIENLKRQLDESKHEEIVAALQKQSSEFARQARKHQARNVKMQANFNKFKAASDLAIAKLKKQIADAPATW